MMFNWVPDESLDSATPGSALTSVAPPAKLPTDSAAGVARLFNNAELARNLGYTRPHTSDLDLLLAAYRRWGPAFPSRVIGDFAVVFADSDTGRVVAFRDFPGVLPLYWARARDGRLTFGTDLAAVAARCGLPTALSVPFFARHLAGDLRFLDTTPYAGLRRVAPGTYVEWSANGTPTTRRWWHPPPTDPALAKASLADLGAELAAQLREAVAARMTLTTGVELSGGLDSSAITGFAADVSQQQLRAFIWAPGEEFDNWLEQPFVAAMEESSGAALDVVTSDDSPELKPMPGLPPYPFGTMTGVRPASYRRAVDVGIDRLLSGWGGDQAASFDGAAGVGWLLRHGRGGDIARKYAQSTSRGGSARRFTRREVLDPLLGPSLDRADRRFLAGMLTPAWASAVAEAATVAAWATPGSPELRRQRVFSNGMLERRLEMDNWEAAPYGISYSYPLLDRRVLELCLSIPADRWQQGDANRALFREAIRGAVPDVVRLRPTKLAPDPTRPLRAAQANDAMRKRVAELAADERVRQVIPGLNLRDLRRLAPRRRTLLLLTCEFLAAQDRDLRWR